VCDVPCRLLNLAMPQYLCRLHSAFVRWGRQSGASVFGASASRHPGGGHVVNLAVMRGQHSRPASTWERICSATDSGSVEQQEEGQNQQGEQNGQQQPAGQQLAGRLHRYGVPVGTCCLYERGSISGLPYEQACMLQRPLPVLIGAVELLTREVQPFRCVTKCNHGPRGCKSAGRGCQPGSPCSLGGC